MIRIATCQYQLEALDWNAYTKKIIAILTKAKKKDADLLLLPEYAGIEIGGHHTDDATLFAAIQSHLPHYISFYQQLAMEYGIHIQPGTILVETQPGEYLNRAHFFSPNGAWDYQDKLQLTEFEKTSGLIAQGSRQVVFETPFGKLGIAICYDSEFPEIVRKLVEVGAEIILVPSYTSSAAGYHRVTLSSRARAIENQCYVATSFIVGSVNLGNTSPETTIGRSAIFCPADNGFPEDGIIKQGPQNKVAMVIGDIAMEKLTTVRQQGQVHLFEDSRNCASRLKNNINLEIINMR